MSRRQCLNVTKNQSGSRAGSLYFLQPLTASRNTRIPEAISQPLFLSEIRCNSVSTPCGKDSHAKRDEPGQDGFDTVRCVESVYFWLTNARRFSSVLRRWLDSWLKDE